MIYLGVKTLSIDGDYITSHILFCLIVRED